MEVSRTRQVLHSEFCRCLPLPLSRTVRQNQAEDSQGNVMASQRRYPEGVRAALHVMCGGGCYRPECGEPAIRFVDGVPVINLEIAHIHALDDNGPRAVRQMSVPERNAISNLIWVCKPCHERIDADEETYTSEVLKEWKRDREGRPLGQLSGLRDLDRDGMEELLKRAMAEIRTDMAAFTEHFPDLAGLLRETIEGLPSLDPESIEMLNDAALRLDLPEYAPLMHTAAARLDLPDYAPMVYHSASSLGLPDYAPMLLSAARELDLPARVPELCRTADSLSSTAEQLWQAVGTASDVARDLQSALFDAANLEPAGPAQTVHYIHRIPPKLIAALIIGWAVGTPDLSPRSRPLLTLADPAVMCRPGPSGEPCSTPCEVHEALVRAAGHGTRMDAGSPDSSARSARASSAIWPARQRKTK
jgi:hypothetical protein